jgi:hypothetical protein
MRHILFAAAASLALSATPALATQVSQGGHRVAAGYEHVLQADAGGGNAGRQPQYADAGGGNAGRQPQYAEAGGGNGGRAPQFAEAGGGNSRATVLLAEAGGGDGGRQPQYA